MSSCDLHKKPRIERRRQPRRLARLAQMASLRGEALDRWLASRIGVVGAGALGSRLVPELVRSGVSGCAVFDHDRVSVENLGTQTYTAPGAWKAVALCATCEAIRPGIAVARPMDVRHTGVGEFVRLDAIVDASDDAKLEWPLTVLSNGLQKPLLRLAVDGSGERDMGRVQVSHGGMGHACRLCAKSLEQLLRAAPRTPCPTAPAGGPPPTLAGSGLSMAVVGIALAQLQRLLGSTRPEAVLDSQIVVDLDDFQILALRERRSQQCLSGHVVWELLPVPCDASQTTLGEMFELAEQQTGVAVEALEPYGHALCQAARCHCGAVRRNLGSAWATPPRCRRCRRPMVWELHTRKPTWSRAEARAAGILSRTLTGLGLPDKGAMIVARTAGRPPARMVLQWPPVPEHGDTHEHDLIQEASHERPA